MASEQGMDSTLSVDPDYRCVMVISCIFLSINFDIQTVQQHERLGQAGHGEMIGNNVGQSFSSSPHDIYMPVVAKALGVHSVVIEHLQGSATREWNCLGETDAGRCKERQENARFDLSEYPHFLFDDW